MLISFVAVQAMGYTLNMIVLFSLILVLGMNLVATIIRSRARARRQW